LLLGLHLLRENVSVDIVGWEGLLLEPIIAVVEIAHKVTIIIIDEVATLTSV
jgi:hypothetical protein